MNILCFGDVCGKIGIKAVKNGIDYVKTRHQVDLIIANVENVSGFKSLKKSDYDLLKSMGIDVMTSGNHILDKDEAIKILEEEKDILRPINFPKDAPGRGTLVINKCGLKVRVTNIIGNVFMSPYYNNHLEAMDSIKHLESDIHLVDFHSEANGEKVSFAMEYDGKVNAVFGSHTHVQTSDITIFPKETAYITDIGMNGPHNSCLGLRHNEVIFRNKTLIGAPYTYKADAKPQTCCILLKFNGKKLYSISRILINPNFTEDRELKMSDIKNENT